MGDFNQALTVMQDETYLGASDYDDYIRIRQDFESYDFDLYEDFNIAQTNDDHNWNSNQKQGSQHTIYSRNLDDPSNTNRDQDHKNLQLYESYDAPRSIENNSWNPI